MKLSNSLNKLPDIPLQHNLQMNLLCCTLSHAFVVSKKFLGLHMMSANLYMSLNIFNK